MDSIRIVPLDVLIDPARWPRQEDRVGVGGAAAYFPHPGYIALLDQDSGEWLQFRLTYSIAHYREESTQLPSLLGWDVLGNFAVVCDWSSRTITLDLRN
jgi:hypothetical protein